MHLYLHLVNESGDSIFEQEKGFLSWIGYVFCDYSKVTDNPDTEGKPRSINQFLVFYKCYSHKSMLCAFK